MGVLEHRVVTSVTLRGTHPVYVARTVSGASGSQAEKKPNKRSGVRAEEQGLILIFILLPAVIAAADPTKVSPWYNQLRLG